MKDTTEPMLVERMNEFGDLDQGLGGINDPSSNALRKVHNSLFGRYKWFVSLGLILGVLGGTAGYKYFTPLYQSTGQIQVSPILPRILYANEDNRGMPPMFDAFIGTQVAMIKSQRVINMAMDTPEWRALKRGLSIEAKSEFIESLKVGNWPRSQLVFVSFEDESRSASKIAVKSLIESYQKIYGEQDVQTDTKRILTLEQHRNVLNNMIKGRRDRVKAIAETFGSEALLTQTYQGKLLELQTVSKSLQQAQMALAAVGAQPGQDGDVPSDEEVLDQMITIESIAAVDAKMRAYLAQKEQLETQITQKQYRFGENHRSLIDLRNLLATVTELIEQRIDEFDSQILLTSSTPMTVGIPAHSTPEQLQAKEQTYSQLHDRLKQEATRLGLLVTQINSLKQDNVEDDGRLKDVNARLEQLNLESSVGGRIRVLSYGDQPLRPVNLKNRNRQTAFGALGGVSIGSGLVLLFCLLDRRYRHLEDAQASIGHLPILGILPRLPEDLSDPRQSAIASQCVHQIRTHLQLNHDPEKQRVFCVTSSGPGDGKTSLSLALGLSFAASGSRTLLVDFDLNGWGLTARLDHKGNLAVGQILVRDGYITKPQLAQALDLARQSEKQLGQALIELGFIGEVALEEALSTQENMLVGLPEALDGQDLMTCTVPTGTPGLAVLPIGNAKIEHVGSLSPASIRQLIQTAKEQYDMILFDTGPILGSLEASIVASQVDGVIFTVSHGVQKSLAENAVAQLKVIHAKIAGVVFNRAENRDLLLYGSTSSLSSQSSRDADQAFESQTPVNGEASLRMGPVVHATASGLTNPDNGKNT